MKDLLKKAKQLLKEGKLEESIALIKKVSSEIKGYVDKCPGCGAEVAVLQKENQEYSDCPKCGALWGKHNVGEPLLKYEHNIGNRMNLLKKKDVIDILWRLHRQGDPDVEAFDINHFDATGWLKKALAKKLGLPIPGEKPQEEELRKVYRKEDGTYELGDPIDKKKYSGSASDYIGEKIKHLKEKEGKTQEQAVGQAMGMARQKGYKMPAKKSQWEEFGYGDRLSKEDVLDGMLQMIKVGEEVNRINRHTVARFEATNEIDEDVLKMVYRKLGKNFNALNKKDNDSPKEVIHSEWKQHSKQARKKPHYDHQAETKQFANKLREKGHKVTHHGLQPHRGDPSRGVAQVQMTVNGKRYANDESHEALGEHVWQKISKTGGPPKDVEAKVEAKAGKDIGKEKRMSACPECECYPCECKEMKKEGKCPRCERHPCACPDAKKTYKVKKTKGDSDMYDDKKRHAHHRRGALKPILAKDKKKS